MPETNKWEDTKSDFPYEDILYLEHPNPRRHERLSMSSRAGQFAPFAALTGYEDEIEEVTRYTSKKKELTEAEKEKLDEVLKEAKDKLLKITYFEKDLKKTGGKYQDIIGYIHRIDSIHHLIILKDKQKIRTQDIVKIEIIESQE